MYRVYCSVRLHGVIFISSALEATCFSHRNEAGYCWESVSRKLSTRCYGIPVRSCNKFWDCPCWRLVGRTFTDIVLAVDVIRSSLQYNQECWVVNECWLLCPLSVSLNSSEETETWIMTADDAAGIGTRFEICEVGVISSSMSLVQILMNSGQSFNFILERGRERKHQATITLPFSSRNLT
jgi:hypothetical protein